MGPWETNPLYLFMRSAVVKGGATVPVAQAQAFNDLLFLWQGFVDNPGAAAPVYYDGLYGESQRPGLLMPTNNPSGLGFGVPVWQRILGGPRPGVSRWYDAVTFLPHDPFALAREMGVRPFMLQPQLSIASPDPGTFFDYMPPTFGATLNPFASPAAHVASSYGSPYDYHDRGATGVDIAGHVVYA